MTFCKSLYLSVVVMNGVIAYDLLSSVDYYRPNQYVVVEIANEMINMFYENKSAIFQKLSI